MSGGIALAVRRYWDGKLGTHSWLLDLLLTPLSWLWAGVTAIRNARFDWAGGVRVSDLIVVSVGNLAVGGTGKTPIASWVARQYVEDGLRPALLLSGYGRDEKLLHAKWTADVPVLVARDRVTTARRARTVGCHVAVMDDGFQHRALERDLDIVVIAAEDPFPGRPLPRGPYREGPKALARADVVLVTRRTASEADARTLAERAREWAPDAVTAGVHFSGGRLMDLNGQAHTDSLGDVLAVAAIGRPATFEWAVAGLVDGSVELRAFPDHHEYTERDVARLKARAGDRPIVVTEKDAVKLAIHRERIGGVYVLSQSLAWDWGEDEVRSALPRPRGREG